MDLLAGFDPGAPRTSPSKDWRSLICSGSSSSASCSARSPVSLQREKSEPAESEDRRPAFSLDSCSSEVEWSSGGCRGEPRLRKGMGTEVDEGMVPVVAGWPEQPYSWEEMFGCETWGLGFGMQAVD